MSVLVVWGGFSSEQVWTGLQSWPPGVTSWGRGPRLVGPCMVRSSASWLIVTWDLPLPWTDTHDWKHYLPATSLAAAKNIQVRPIGILTDRVLAFKWLCIFPRQQFNARAMHISRNMIRQRRFLKVYGLFEASLFRRICKEVWLPIGQHIRSFRSGERR